MEFSIDLDVTPKPRPDPTATLFATVPGQAADLGNGECIFRPQHQDQPHVMTHQVLAALDRCRAFRSVDEHVAAIRQATPGAPDDGVRRVFNNLAERGLIIAAEDFAAPFLGTTAAPQSELAGLFIRAGDRPAQLQRLLESLRAQASTVPRAHALTILDDSRARDAVTAQSRLLHEHAEATGGVVRHVDGTAWQRIQDTLAAALPQHRAALDDLIGRDAAGQPRSGRGCGWNLALLLAAGKRMLFGDDDFLLPLKLHPLLQDGVELEARETSTAVFHTDAAAALASGLDADFDLLGWHLDFCGANVGRLFDPESRLQPTLEQWRNIAPSRLPRLVPDARIVATMNGRRGHVGSESNDWMYTLDSASSQDLYHDRNRYLRLIESPQAWIGADRAAMMASTPFAPFAQDLSRLPAFVSPDARGDAGLFGAMTHLIEPQSWILHLPTSSGHVRIAQTGAKPARGVAAERSFDQFLGEFLERFEPDLFAASASARLASAAARLEDLAAADDRALLRMLDEYLLATHSAQIQRLQGVAAAAGALAPVYWSADLQALIKTHAKAMLHNGPPRLAGWSLELDAAGCARRFRAELGRFAQLMRAWPEIWNAARDLGASGRLG